MFGTAALGLPTFWHNRAGLALAEDAPKPDIEAQTLAPPEAWVSRFAFTSSD
jgi:2-haloacid dehalogenase